MHKSGFYRRRSVLAVVFLTLGVSFSAGSLAGKEGRTQEELIKELYHAYLTSPLWCDEAKMARYLTTDLASLVSRTCGLDLELDDPLTTGQDPLPEEILKTLKVSPVSGASNVYEARFNTFPNGGETTVTFDLRRQDGAWRISNVQAGYSLRDELSAAR